MVRGRYVLIRDLIRDPEPVCKDEIDEAKEAAQGRPGQELLNESFMVRDPD